MSRTLTCPLGHQWSTLEVASGTAGSTTVCPVCGCALDLGQNTQATIAADADSVVDPQPTLSSRAEPALAARLDRWLDAGQVSAPAPTRAPSAGKPADEATLEGDASSNQVSKNASLGWPAISGYEIRAELGRGGMGIVYRALDSKRGHEVALKTLQGMSPDALYRFKQEFRLLADVSHPNLVSLYELISDGQQWFFTMELLKGVDFLCHVRSVAAGPLRWQRLREALAQLAEAVVALHDAGRLHRDLKPSNVLVTAQGRVVVLDFGLAADLGQRGLYESTEQSITGTIAYMSPEQAAPRPLSSATDWYSVGVMLYEAMAGRLPYTGSTFQVLRDKEEKVPPPPHTIAPGIPEDLDALCVKLLEHDPEKRPTGRDLLRRLKNLPTQEAPVFRPTHQERHALLGRDAHLNALSNALEAMLAGRTVVVYLSGRSGMGKSALIQAFLDGLPADKRVVVLAGQCYEKETVPYKAFDSLVDALGRYSNRLSPAELQAVLPRDVRPLTRVFPVLRHLEAAMPARHAMEIPDPLEVRRRAFAALRELLGRLGDRTPLVLTIDDLQWGDVDSLDLFFELLRPPEPPRFLLLGSYRSEETATSPFLQALAARDEGVSVVDRRQLTVDVLPQREARELAAGLFGDQLGSEVEAEAIALESGGNPLFIYELVQHARSRAEQPGAEKDRSGAISLSKVLWGRIQRLPDEARRLLEVLAVAGRPMREADVFRAAGTDPEHRAAQAQLRASRLLRATGSAEAELLTTYHDRVRETITAHLPPVELRDCHRRLAQALEESKQADPEALALHFQGAEQTEKAIHYFGLAAGKAMAALAFDRAAGFYQSMLKLLPDNHPERRHLRGQRAEALANARRGTEAAPEFLAAAEGAPAGEALDLQRRAVEQFLYSGHLDEGRAVIQKLLASMGMKLPKTPWRALVSIVYHRFLLWLRGLSYRERSEKELSPQELLRLDTCWAVGLGLSHVDPICGAEFQTRYLLLALRAGEPVRLHRGLAIEVGQSATGGGQARRRTEKLLRATQALAERIQQPYATGMTWLSTGAAAFMEGRWREAREQSERAEKILREQCVGAACERNEANFYAIRSLEFLGDLKDLSLRLPALLKDAQDRGDLYAATNLSTRLSYFVSLMNDQPDKAQQDLRSAIERWSRQSFFLQHYFEMYAQMDISHYRGDFQSAWDFLNDRWPALSRSLILRVQSSRLTILHVRARSALGYAALPATPAAQRRKLLRFADRQAAAIAREDMAWSNPIALLLRAGIAATRADLTGAQSLLAAAEKTFLAADMHLYTAVARRRRGQFLGGAEGKELVAAGERWMLSQSIRNPARWTAMYAPGFPD